MLANEDRHSTMSTTVPGIHINELKGAYKNEDRVIRINPT